MYRPGSSALQKADIKHTYDIHLSYRVLIVAKKTEILNIRLPDELILELDNLVKKKIFKSRSEAVREFTREYVQEQELAAPKQNAKNKKTEQGGGRW